MTGTTATEPLFPFGAIVGMDDMRLALVLNAISPAIGGVLVRGEKGTAKSTTVRALTAVLEGEADFASIYCTHPDDRAVRASLAEHVGRRELELAPFAFTGPAPSDGILISPRLPEDQAVRVIEALISLGSDGTGLLPQLGLFDTEGFALDGHVVPRHLLTSKHEPLLMIEVANDLSCRHLWTQSGTVNGRRASEWLGQPLADVLGEEAAPAVCPLVSESFLHLGGGRIDYHVGIDEDARWFSAEVAPPNGEPDSTAAVIIRDVTDSRALEQELFHLASYPLLTPDPVLEIDRNGALLYANRAAHERFPGLVSQGADHPIIAGMLAVNRSPNRARRAVLREVQVGANLWKLTVLSPPDTDFIRAQVIDVTEPSPQRARTRALELVGDARVKTKGAS